MNSFLDFENASKALKRKIEILGRKIEIYFLIEDGEKEKKEEEEEEKEGEEKEKEEEE